MWKTRVAAPHEARTGESIEVRTLIAHPMESGFRLDSIGKPIPRDIIVGFSCDYLGTRVFEAEFFPAISANPYLSFYVTALRTGTMTLTWTDQHGNSASAQHYLTVLDSQ